MAQVYYGWEESDYGNLAMIKGVVDHGFTQYDMNHLPMYYFLAGVVMSVVGDAGLAGLIVSMGAGVLTVVLGVLLANQVGGRLAAGIAAVFLVVQPELALYSSSTLREPVYAVAVMACLLSLVRDRLAWASLFAGVAFLTRMDALLILGPVLFVHAVGARLSVRRLFSALLPLFSAVIAWSLYCGFHPEYQTFAFWGHSVSVNLETGGAQEGGGLAAWAKDGAGVSGVLWSKVLLSRIGLGLWLAWMATFLLTPWRSHGPRRTLGLASLLLLGFWLAIGFTAQHEPGHNLYWKWLHGVLPVGIVLGSATLVRAHEKMGAWMGRAGSSAVLALVLLQALLSMRAETQRQIQLSEQINGPQVSLAKWIEAETSENAALILDNIPERWLSRRDHGRSFHSWMDIVECPEIPEGCGLTRAEFGNYLFENGISYVLWFKERWTKAPIAANYLGDEQDHVLGPVMLQPLRSDRLEEVDGWVFYEVVASGR